MKTTVVTDPEELDALRRAWSALFARCPQATPFQSPEWLLAWRRIFLAEPILAICVWRDGELTGLAPFFLHDPAGRRQLNLIGNGVSDYLGLLAEAQDGAAAAEAVAGELLARRDAWSCCDLRDLSADSPLLEAPIPASRDEIEPEAPCPLAPLPADPEAVLDQLERRSRSDLQRRARRLAEQGEVTFEVARDEPSRARYLAELMAVHEARWRTRGEGGIFTRPGVAAFHELATRALLKADMLRLHVLKLNGRVIAANYALHRGERAYTYIHGFDPDHAAYAPGGQLLAQVLREAVREGATAFDFLRGGEAYKYAWGAIDQPKRRRRIWA